MHGDETQAHDPTTRATLKNLSSVQPAPGLPRQIGNYQIKKLLGSGGMGAVYLAVQEHPRRTVALKVMKSEIASPGALRRFEYESQLLARLRHPGIAQIFEAGTHDQGTGIPVPFFAMEYVSGARTLSAYADEQKLGVRARLELFAQVCDAVHHGHQKGIIHRDLKPANILVDAGGQPKIIDYGVARGADADMAVATLQTNVGQLVGTIQYMSPEQCAGDPHNVDVRSDVYALGVVLYELLAGRPPYDISSSPIPEATRIVCEKSPERLSAVNVQLRGDVETIVSKALEKDRAARYQSVNDFADDIRRFLRDEPIHARPIGPVGRTLKWMKRNREVTTVGLVAAVLLIGSSTYLIQRVVTEKIQAESNLRAANQFIELMKSTLEFKTPEGRSRLKEGWANVEQMLDDASDNLRRNSLLIPGAEAEFRQVLGAAYRELGKLPKEKDQFQQAMALWERNFPADSREVAAGLHGMGIVAFDERNFEKAHEFYSRELAILRKIRKGDHADLAMCLHHLGQVEARIQKDADAERHLIEAMEMRKRLFTPDSVQVAQSLNALGGFYMSKESFTKAEPLFRSALAMIQKHNGPNDEGVYFTSINLGRCARQLGRPQEAAEHFRRAMDCTVAVLGERHVRVASTKLELAKIKLDSGIGDNIDPEAFCQAALEIYRDAYALSAGTDHIDIANALKYLGQARVASGKPEQAESPLREAVSIMGRLKPPPKPADLAEARFELGACLLSLKKDAEAGPLLTEAVAALREARGPADKPTQARIRRLVREYRAAGQEQRAVDFESMLPMDARAEPGPAAAAPPSLGTSGSTAKKPG